MRSIPVAMMWEFFARRPWNLPAAIIWSNAIGWFLLYVFQLTEIPLTPNDSHTIIISMVVSSFSAFLFASAVFAQRPEIRRLYAYPVSTTRLLAYQLVPLFTLVVLQSALANALTNSVYELDWPVWGPALFAGVVVLAVQAALWFTQRAHWLAGLLSLFIVPMGIWFKSRYGEVGALPSSLWTTVSPFDLLALSVMATISVAFAHWALGRSRRGEPAPELGLSRWAGQTLLRLIHRETPRFRDAKEALSWELWTHKGSAYPIAVGFGLLAGLIAWVLFSRDPAVLLAITYGGGFVLLGLAFVTGCALGQLGNTSVSFDMGSFLAARPITTQFLSSVFLKVCVKSLIIGWTVWALALACAYGYAKFTLGDLPVYDERIPRSTYIGLTLLGPWVAMVGISGLLVHGRPRPGINWLVGGCTALLCGLAFHSTLPGPWRELVGKSCMVGLAFTIVSASLWFIVQAWKKQFLGYRELFYSTFGFAGMALVLLTGPIPGNVLVLSMGAITTYLATLTPIAVVPLALEWNRIR